jgi:TatD DNase family protein
MGKDIKMLIDSHCHLDMLDLGSYNQDLDKALAAAKNNDVQYFLCAGIDLIESQNILLLAQKYPFIRTSAGLHPTEEINKKVTAQDIIAIAENPLVIAIGETGLDYWQRDQEITEEQKEHQRFRFREHIRAALALKKPLVIHSRSAGLETLQILQEEKAFQVGGVFHCFTDELKIAEKAIEIGFYIGVPGIITFKNAKILQEIIKKLPLTSILLETDAPFLAPVPHRGKPNEPAYLFFIAECVARLKNISYETVAKKTCENFVKLFDWP